MNDVDFIREFQTESLGKNRVTPSIDRIAGKLYEHTISVLSYLVSTNPKLNTHRIPVAHLDSFAVRLIDADSDEAIESSLSTRNMIVELLYGKLNENGFNVKHDISASFVEIGWEYRFPSQ